MANDRMIIDSMRKRILSKRAVYLLILIALPFLFFYKQLLHPLQVIYPAGDILGAYSPWKNFLVSHVLNYGTLPLWNPFEFSGTPFIANVSAGLFYPFGLIFFIFPVDLAFGYAFILDFVLLALFTYFFAMAIGIKQKAALFTAIALTFSGTVFISIYPGHLFILDAFIWFPLLLYFWEKGLQSKKNIFVFLSAIPIALMLLAGNTQITLYAMFFALIYVIFRVLSDKINFNNLKFAGLMVGLSVIFGLLISSVQVIPTLEFLKTSSRGGGVDYSFASSFSLPPKQALAFILPFFFGSPLDNSFWGRGNFWGLCGYLGTIVPIFALLSLLKRKDKFKVIFLVFSIFTVLFAFGKYFVIFWFFYKFVPLFDLFRVPARILFFYAFSMSILAGIGFEYFIEKNEKILNSFFDKKVRIALFIVSFFCLLFAILLKFVNLDNAFNDLVLRSRYGLSNSHSVLYSHVSYSFTIFSLFFFIFSAILIFFAKIKKNFAAILIICLLVIELFIFDTQFVDTKNSDKYYKIPDEIQFIRQDKSDFRIFDWDTATFYLAERVGIQSVTGYDPIHLGYFRDYLWNLGPHEENAADSYIQISKLENLNVLRLLNVKYVLSKNKINDVNNFTLVFKKQYYVYELLNMLPRAYLVDDNIYNSMLGLNNKLPANFTPVSEKMINANRLEFLFKSEHPTHLILSEVWYPGWIAYDNDRKVKIDKISIFRSISVAKGNHLIKIEYVPFSYKIGLIISLFSSLILIIGIVYSLNLFKLKTNALKLLKRVNL
jgi:hypothetical protein